MFGEKLGQRRAAAETARAANQSDMDGGPGFSCLAYWAIIFLGPAAGAGKVLIGPREYVANSQLPP